MKKRLSVLCVLVCASMATATVKNVIVLIPDGCSQTVQTAARWYKGAPLALDGMNVAMAKTYMANSIITDSASAASALATGYKNTDGMLSVGPAEDIKPNLTGFTSPIAPYAPMETILEAAKKAGKATGLVATSRITHATPAAYASHQWTRNDDNAIMEDMVYQDMEVVLGGGLRHLADKRTDGEDLIQVLVDRGYAVVTTADEMAAVTSGKIWGGFNASHMQPDIDRDDNAPTEPSIAEMTVKALELLSQDEDGFFIMIEGSQVDWAGHQNDPIYMMTDFLAFDAAVQVALDFAAAHGDTMVIAFPDHNTGALSIGHNQINGVGVTSDYAGPAYTSTTIEDMIDPIKDATASINTVLANLPENPDLFCLRDIMVAYWGQWWANCENMKAEQAQEILNIWTATGDSYPVSTYISSEFTVFGWTTHGHTGEDVPVWCHIEGDAQGPHGVVDNTDLAQICAAALGVSLTGSDGWTEYDAADVLDTLVLEENPVATIDGVQYPVSKDIRILADGTVENMVDITVYAVKSGKVYIPKI